MCIRDSDLPGRLVDRLTDNGVMSRPDAKVTGALRDLHSGTDATRAIDTEALNEATQKAFGFDLPNDWSGRVQVQGNVTEEIDGQQHVTSAASLGVQPEFWGVYAQHENGMHPVSYTHLDVYKRQGVRQAGAAEGFLCDRV